MNENVIEEKKDINFIACGSNKKYDHFILPYLTSILTNVPNSHIEIYMNEESIDSIFNKDVKKVLKEYENSYSTNSLNHLRSTPIYKYGGGTIRENLLRWLIIPTTKSLYTYIGDIDIIILNKPDVILHNEKCFKYTDGIYANFARKMDNKKMTGCMLVNTSKYYGLVTPTINKCINNPTQLISDKKMLFDSDEKILYKIMLDANCPILKEEDNLWKRKLHGIHTSPNRPWIKCKENSDSVDYTSTHTTSDWFTVGISEKILKSTYQKYIKTPLYRKMSTFFDNIYINNYLKPLEEYWNINNE